MSKTFVLSFLLLSTVVFFFGFSPYHVLVNNVVLADDASYLSHAFTLGLDFNLKYEGILTSWKALTGIAAHPIGPGLCAAPFVALFSILDRLSGHEVIYHHIHYQNSWSYFGFVFAAFFYFLLGVFFYFRALAKLRLSFSGFHFIFCIFSFGLLYYVLYRPVMGHAFEFFSISVCFYTSVLSVQYWLQTKKIAYKSMFFCALAIFLTLQIRPADMNVILLPGIVMSFCLISLSRRGLDVYSLEWGLSQLIFPSLKKITYFFVVQCLLLAIVALPFIVLNMYLYHMPYPSSEVMYGVKVNPVPEMHSVHQWLAALGILIQHITQIKVILFSSEFGLFFSSAFIFFGVLFLVWLALSHIHTRFFTAAMLLLQVGGYVGLPIAIILFWQSLGDAYGYRFLYCLFPLAVLGYATFVKRLNSKYKNWRDYPLGYQFLQGGIFALLLFGLTSQIFYGLNDELKYKDSIPNAFGRAVGGSAVGYHTAVFKHFLQPKIWFYLMSTRTIGFLSMGFLMQHEATLQERLPSQLQAKWHQFRENFTFPDRQIYFQIAILGTLFIGGIYFILWLNNVYNKRDID